MHLPSCVLTYDEPTLTNTADACTLDCLFLCTVHTKQGGYECYHIPTCQVITQPYITAIPATTAIIATINALGKSDGIQSLKITNLCRHHLFDSTDPSLLAGVDDDDDDDDTSLAGMQGNDTSLTGVPIPTTTIMTNGDNDLDTESNHNSIDPNEANKNLCKASVHCTRSHIQVHSITSEPPQHPVELWEISILELVVCFH